MSVIGIDLGTTNSCFGHYRRDKSSVDILENKQGDYLTPSCVSFSSDERLVGDVAKSELSSGNAENTLYQIKRIIGRTYNDPNVQEDQKLWSFKIKNDMNKPKLVVTFKGKQKVFCPEEISAMVLEYIKSAAEERLGEQVKGAVITVPTHFNNAQRSATLVAGRIAGLNVLELINEPTAAAIAYGLDKPTDKPQRVLVFDLGGGTFDVTVVDIKNTSFDVRAAGGDTHLGGDDFDNRMVKSLMEQFKKENGRDMSWDKQAINRLRVECEVAKRRLSVVTQATVQVTALHDGINFKTTVRRAWFEEINRDYFDKTQKCVEDTLTAAGTNRTEIDQVLLVGGSTRIPKVQELLRNFFGKNKVNKTINPDEAVAYGAAAKAAKLSSHGLSWHAIHELSISDVVPLSLGWQERSGNMVTVVERNTKIPTEKWASCVTARDYQTELSFSIFEGERAIAHENNRLGSFIIREIPRALRGVEKCSICFSLDANGILNVRVRSKSTGRENEITIDRKGKLEDEEIRRMIADAKKFAEEDAKWKERCKQTHELEDYVHNVKHAVNGSQFRAKISPGDRSKITDKCDAIIAWIDDVKNPQVYDSVRKQTELESICRPVLERVTGGSEFLRKIKK